MGAPICQSATAIDPPLLVSIRMTENPVISEGIQCMQGMNHEKEHKL